MSRTAFCVTCEVALYVSAKSESLAREFATTHFLNERLYREGITRAGDAFAVKLLGGDIVEVQLNDKNPLVKKMRATKANEVATLESEAVPCEDNLEIW